MAIYTLCEYEKVTKAKNQDQVLGEFKDVILDEKYKNIDFLTLDFNGSVNGNIYSGVINDKEVINKIIDMLEPINLTTGKENIDGGDNDYMTLSLSGSDAAFLRVTIDEGNSVLINTSAISNKLSLERYEIENNSVNNIEKMAEILKYYSN